MTAKESGQGMRTIQIAVSVVCLALVATWAWSLSITGRLATCEARVSAFADDIKEIKEAQKDMLKTQMDMWRYLKAEGK